MTGTVAEKPRGIQGKFLAAVGIAFLLQLVLILIFGREPAIAPRAVKTQPTFTIGDPRPAELVALENPTLFVLPHPQEFSGESWMKAPRLRYQSERWSEPLQLLPLPQEALGETFLSFVQRHPPVPFKAEVLPEPFLTIPVIPPPPRVFTPSGLRLVGGIEQRRMLNPPQLPLSNEVVTNSVIEVMVDPQGYVFSAMLTAKSGSTNDLDALAMRLARSIRFESIEPTGPDRASQPEAAMMQGTLIFEWQIARPTNTVIAP